MRHLNFTVSANTAPQIVCYTYNIADSLYQSNLEIAALKVWLVSRKAAQPNTPSLQLLNDSKAFNKSIYRERCLIGNDSYPVRIKTNERGSYWFESGQHRYQISQDGIKADVPNIDITLLSGPVLLLNLAQNNTFCVHASAFVLNNKTFIVMADSGTGKSTIARYIEEQTPGMRIADDIVPMKIVNNKVLVLPNFIQLKLSNAQQYSGSNVKNEVILIFATKSECNTQLEKTDAFDAIKKMITHSVATKLFAPKELQKHLQFCYTACVSSQHYKLNYKHGKQSLVMLLEQLYALT